MRGPTYAFVTVAVFFWTLRILAFGGVLLELYLRGFGGEVVAAFGSALMPSIAVPVAGLALSVLVPIVLRRFGLDRMALAAALAGAAAAFAVVVLPILQRVAEQSTP